MIAGSMDPPKKEKQDENRSVGFIFDRIIASLHEAMLDDSRWHEASALIDEACGTTGTQLLIVGRESHDDATWFLDRLHCDRELREEPTNGCAGSLPHAGLNIYIDEPNGVQIVWALAGPGRPGGRSSEQKAMIERLVPHIRQFVRVRQALAGARALRASLTALLDNTLMGVIYLDRRGMIVEANGRARAILCRGDGLLDRAGLLRAPLAADDVRLGSLLARVLPSAGPAVGGSVSLARSSVLPRLTLHVTPVGGHDAGFGIGDVAALVLIVDPGAKPRTDPEHVATTLGLTPAESRVAVALTEGATMKEIAAATHRAESTVRELVKRIHLKLGVSRRAELVRMVPLPGRKRIGCVQTEALGC